MIGKCCLLAALTAALAATPSLGESVHGSVTSLDGQSLTIRTDNAKSLIVELDPNVRVIHNRREELSDIQPGVYVGTFSVVSKDKTLRAQGVRVFPDTMRGSGEGQYPMAQNADRLMTFGSVTSLVPEARGTVLNLSFRGAASTADGNCTGRAPADGTGCAGNAAIFVARGVPVLSIESADTSLLLPGTVISADTAIDASGLTTAKAITIERDAPVPKD